MISDFFGWLLDRMLYMSDGWFAFCVMAFTGGLITLVWALIGSKGGVSMGEDPVIPPVPPQPRQVTTTTYTRETRTEWVVPVVEFVAAVDEAATVVLDLTDTVQFRMPDETEVIEVEVIEDPKEAPIFWQIKRPPPYELETFTTGWTRKQIERALAAGEAANRG